VRPELKWILDQVQEAAANKAADGCGPDHPPATPCIHDITEPLTITTVPIKGESVGECFKNPVRVKRERTDSKVDREAHHAGQSAGVTT
jgi:hypothetical protein